MAEKTQLAPGVYLVMEKDNEVLFMKRPDKGYQPGKYMLPGGGVEKSEPPMDATRREVLEELGIAIDLKDLQPIHVMCRGAHDSTGERVDIFFRITRWDGEPTIMEPHKCTELTWFPLNNLPKTIPAYVRAALANYQNNIIYSELDY